MQYLQLGGWSPGDQALVIMQSLSTKNMREIEVESEHEKVVRWSDESSGYRGIIAIHSTALGPAVGGTRFWNYESDELATLDALRLSRGMSYKNALAGLPFGGGKAVIIGDHRRFDREQIFRAHGRFVEMLAGRYITAEDVGTTPADMEVISRETRHVGGLPGKSGNPSPKTAFGVFRAMQACAMQRWGTDDLSGRTVAIQGCGSTGYYLAENLHAAGARLIVCDVDPTSAGRVADQFAAKTVAPDEIFGVQADVFAPCALGGVLNDETIPSLKVEIVVGSANNQLLADRHGEALAKRRILYAPDYVASSGGIINGCRELLGWNESDTTQKISGIYDRMQTLLELADREAIPPFKAADDLARKLIADATPNAEN
jgi:leucine dehydrogenase